MAESARKPTLNDLYTLGRQIEADRGLAAEGLRERDHAIGQDCSADGDQGRLLFWLDRRQAAQPPEAAGNWWSEAHAALVLRLLSLLLGIATMTGFMLASERALVNVFLFLLLFVLLPLLLSLAAGVVMLRSVRGKPPAVFPLNPARWVARRAIPDARWFRENGAVGRLLLLRYGQAAGAMFALGTLLAFVALLTFNDFAFVWGSTLALSEQAVTTLTSALAAPWSSWLPQAVVGPEVVADTRYHAAQTNLGALNAESRRAWWPFLFMSLLLYALLPRLLLWLLSRRSYQREIQRALLATPGASAVLARMRAPVVNTRAGQANHVDARLPVMPVAEGELLLDWADAIAATGAGVGAARRLAAGGGTPAADLDAIEAINRQQPQRLLVAVKGWEPPMADLADVLAEIRGVERLSLQLVPLPGRELGEAQLRDWQAFAREQPFAAAEASELGEL